MSRTRNRSEAEPGRNGRRTVSKASPPGMRTQGAEGIRLQLYLARSGVASRRACEDIVRQGRVTVNGRVQQEKGARVVPGDLVALDGRTVRPLKKLVYVALNKPRGYLSSNADGLNRPLAADLLKPVIPERLFHVGRLDYLSTGLILFTNDGELARLASHPSSRIEKEYLVEAARAIEESFLKLYKKGIRVGDELYRCKDFHKSSDRAVRITLLEGKNRELRRVFASRNIRLKRIHRIRIGPVTVKGIAPGHFRNLTEREVRWFLSHGSGD